MIIIVISIIIIIIIIIITTQLIENQANIIILKMFLFSLIYFECGANIYVKVIAIQNVNMNLSTIPIACLISNTKSIR